MKEKKIDKLVKWANNQVLFSAVDIHKWGKENFFISAHRRVRELCNTGYFRRLSNQEKTRHCLIYGTNKKHSLLGIKQTNENIAWYATTEIK